MPRRVAPPLRSSLSRPLTLAIITPVLSLVVAAVLLTVQIARLSDAAHWLDHTDAVIARASEVQKQVLDQETGLRGYLLTRDRAFLEPYEHAHPEEAFEALKELVADNPTQVRRLAEAERRFRVWGEGAARERVLAGDVELVGSLEAIRTRKARMDAFRETMKSFMDDEKSLRDERAASLATANRFSFAVVFPLLLLLAGTIAFVSRKQLKEVSGTFMEALDRADAARKTVEAETWVRTQQMELALEIQGDLSTQEIARRAVQKLAAATGADIGAVYVCEGDRLKLRGSVALEGEQRASFGKDEGLAGEALKGKAFRHLTDLPKGYLRVASGVGEHDAVEVALVPAVADGVGQGVLELGFLRPPSPEALSLLARVGELLGASLRSSEHKSQLRDLLEESQRQGEELQAQQEELSVTNEELQQQGDAVRAAHAQLEERKEELEAANSSLEAQRDELARVSMNLREKATELARASQYKSEFLANMSHELRTPLNSSLILAKLLMNNDTKNLTEEQVRFAETIYGAGNDLLALINDILDLSKIEAGKVDVNSIGGTVASLVDPVLRIFEPIARDRGLTFQAQVQGEVEVTTDPQKIQQILKNLLSNAFKFTERGSVRLVARAEGDDALFEVTDSGIGIPPAQQEIIFDAFRQADGTTNRRFGGTGLGLSISRDLARLLGGDIVVRSEANRGSTFTLRVPRHHVAAPAIADAPAPSRLPRASAAPAPAPLVSVHTPAPPRPRAERALAFDDDREHLDRTKPLLMVVEDDASFASILVDLARSLGFQCVVTQTADDAVALASELVPSSVVLDLGLPDHSGLSVLDRMKRNPATRHVPVHVISGADSSSAARRLGAVGYLLKPVRRDEIAEALTKLKERFASVRRLLVIEDDAVQRDAISRLLGGPDVEIVAAASVAEALAQIAKVSFDCIVTDLTLPDGSGYDLLERLAKDEAFSFPPVIVYTGRALTAQEEEQLRRYSSSIIVKGARSPERLLDEVTLFLHQVAAELPPERRRMLEGLRNREEIFEGRTILIAEDDVRNVFALTSLLEPKGVSLVFARNGLQALEVLDGGRQVDLVLMDLMMPEMDGLTAIVEIRKRGGALAKVPIIALTAKAMPDDQERCLQAGANDYIAKPFDVEILLSLVRVWLA